MSKEKEYKAICLVLIVGLVGVIVHYKKKLHQATLVDMYVV